jgi:ATP-binding cassette subfamily B protein
MIKFQHYSGLDQMDCGPSCLRMIAKHYGRSYNLQFLRDKTQLNKDGVSLLGIAEAAEEIGFRTMGVKLSFDKFVSEVPLPCIVHWQQNHFVVVYDIKSNQSWLERFRGGRKSKRDLPDEVDVDTLPPSLAAPLKPFAETPIAPPVKGGETVYVADPARSLLAYSAAEFTENWLASYQNGQAEGVVLVLEPTAAFYEREEEAASSYGFQQLLSYLLYYKKLLIQLLLGLLVGSGLQLLMPFLTQSIVDVGINTQNISFLYLILSAQLMLMAGRLTVEFVRSWILLYISTRINLSILSDFLMKLMRLPVAFFDTKQFGDLMQRINDHQRIESFLTGQTLTVLFSVLNLVVFGVVLSIYNLTIFAIFFIGSLLYLGWVVLFLSYRRRLDFKRFDIAAKNQSSLVQLIQGMQEIKLAGAEQPMRWAWEQLQARLFRLHMKGLSLSQYQQVGAFTLNEGKNILITFLAAQAVIRGQLTLGGMLALQYIIGQLNSPIEQLVGFVQSLQDARMSVERLNEIHSLHDEEVDKSMVTTQPAPGGQAIEVANVTFTYAGAGNEPVLDNISLHIPQGKTTAIVGMSGSGKTTLLKLLLKFYDPQQGDIRLGDKSFRYVSHSQWRRQCGVVLQDGFIFSDTIARNIAVGVERIDAARLQHAVHVANLTTFILALPMGYHTKIGVEGNGISQGQRQRILIARAVYKDPQYIFFDEATNALDATNEAAIISHLNDFFEGRTVVVVAHRLSTVKHADNIIMLEKGRVIEEGTHAALVAARGKYWQLVKNQLELGA